MPNKEIILLPKSQQLLSALGENIKLARLRRKLSAEQVAERSNMSRLSLSKIENGHAGVSIGMYLQVLTVLGLADDFAFIGKDDELGRKLQDAKLISKKRAPKRSENGKKGK